MRQSEQNGGRRTWSVLRQDDNGNVATVKAGLAREEALRLAAEYESKGHKQTYWAIPHDELHPESQPNT